MAIRKPVVGVRAGSAGRARGAQAPAGVEVGAAADDAPAVGRRSATHSHTLPASCSAPNGPAPAGCAVTGTVQPQPREGNSGTAPTSGGADDRPAEPGCVERRPPPSSAFEKCRPAAVTRPKRQDRPHELAGHVAALVVVRPSLQPRAGRRHRTPEHRAGHHRRCDTVDGITGRFRGLSGQQVRASTGPRRAHDQSGLWLYGCACGHWATDVGHIRRFFGCMPRTVSACCEPAPHVSDARRRHDCLAQRPRSASVAQ